MKHLTKADLPDDVEIVAPTDVVPPAALVGLHTRDLHRLCTTLAAQLAGWPLPDENSSLEWRQMWAQVEDFQHRVDVLDLLAVAWSNYLSLETERYYQMME